MLGVCSVQLFKHTPALAWPVTGTSVNAVKSVWRAKTHKTQKGANFKSTATYLSTAHALTAICQLCCFDEIYQRFRSIALKSVHFLHAKIFVCLLDSHVHAN